MIPSLLSRTACYSFVIATCVLSPHAFAQEAHADHHMHNDTDKTSDDARDVVDSLSPARDGSGTSWMPDESPMYGIHAQYKDWQFMYHANLFLQSVHESSQRAEDRAGSINWAMIMAQTKAAGGDLSLRLMMSAENWTATKCGYPDLMQTGESCDGKALHDRQHPHDLFMEIAASYKTAMTQGLGLEIYAAPVGEPALGPVAFPHRLSAFPGPLGPISHHWLDSSHISFGVLTAGLFTSQWKAELSAFNGREPDDKRTDLDLDALDSFAGRISFLPDRHWALQISGAHLKAAEEHEDGSSIDVTRYTGSIMYHRALAGGGVWATTAALGENIEESKSSRAHLLETSLSLMNRQIFSGRVESVQKSGHDLVLETHALEDKTYTLTKAGLGYLYQFPAIRAWNPGLGITATMSFIPPRLETIYGEKRPTEVILFASLRPEAMTMDMGHMNHVH